MKFVDGWLDVAIEIDYLDKSFGKFTQPPKYIVIHGTGTPNGPPTAQSIAEYFATPGVEASTHFIVGRDGVIVQGLPTTLTDWGQGGLTAGHASFLPEGINPNQYCIGIEHCQDVNNSLALTDQQKNSSFQLVKLLCEYLNIPKRSGDANGGIIGHYQIDPVNRPHCPGNYPWSNLWSFLMDNQGTFSVSPEMIDCWQSTKQLFGGTPPRDNTGIFHSWAEAWSKGNQFGPPLTQEYPLTVFGPGAMAQEFAHARCEWHNDQDNVARAHWYSINGLVQF